MNQAMNRERAAETPVFSNDLAEIREMVSACMQCGTCTASCPNAFAMDYTPRQIWRLIQLGLTDDVFNSQTFWLCSSCYNCTLRCPRGLPTTKAMSALKRLGSEKGWGQSRKKSVFYRTFLDNVRKYGRVQETSLMMNYFLRMKDPLLPLSYTSLGLKLMGKGKLHPAKSTHKGRLEAMFNKVNQMEGKS